MQQIDISVTEAIKCGLDVAKLTENVLLVHEESLKFMYDTCVSEAHSLGLVHQFYHVHIEFLSDCRLLDGGRQPVNVTDPKSFHRQKYFEFTDMAELSIRSQYEQKDFQMCLRIEKMLKAALNPHDDDECGDHALQSGIARTSRRDEIIFDTCRLLPSSNLGRLKTLY